MVSGVLARKSKKERLKPAARAALFYARHFPCSTIGRSSGPEERPKSELKTMTDGLRENLQFGPFELSIRERALRRDGVALPLGDRALDILIYLAERPGEVVAKRELMDHVWSDVTVEEGKMSLEHRHMAFHMQWIN
jgi:DNA-binding response OmpR family regulator